MAIPVFRTSGQNALRSMTRSALGKNSQRRWISSSKRLFVEMEKAPAAPTQEAPTAGPSTSSSSSKSTSENAPVKITTIVDQIEKLTLLEAAELVAQLKERLNIQEIAMPAASSAPVAAAPAAAESAPSEEEKPKEKTLFTLKLKGLKDASAKAKVIKEIKALNSNMNLVEAKKFVESAPQVLKEGLTKDEVEKLQKAIEAAGGVTETE